LQTTSGCGIASGNHYREETAMLKPLETIPELVPLELVAERLGVSHWTMRTWLRQGLVPFYKAGKRVLVKEDDVRVFLEENYRPRRAEVLAVPVPKTTRGRKEARVVGKR
jgi:excisionase family DNA binding protein